MAPVALDPSKISISDGYIVYQVDACTCDTPDENTYGHRPGCGSVPMMSLTQFIELATSTPIAAASEGAVTEQIVTLARQIKAIIPDDEELVIHGKGRYISSRGHYDSGTSQFTIKRREQ